MGIEKKYGKKTEDILAAVAEGEYLSEDDKALGIKMPLDFSGWVFEEEVKLENCCFARDVDFSKAEFRGGANFKGAKFYGWADFGGAKFQGKDDVVYKFGVANFYYTTFEGELHFENTEFEGDVDFRYSKFLIGKDVNEDIMRPQRRRINEFTNSKFKGYVSFSGSVFEGEVEFYLTKFEGGAHFNLESISGDISFFGATFKGEFRFGSSKHKDNILSFNQAVFSGKTVFASSKDSSGKISQFSTSNTIFEAPVLIDLPFKTAPDFSKTRFLKTVIIEETWQNDESNVEKEFENIEHKNLETMENKCRFFKNYFSNIGNHFKEIEYFKYEMRARGERLKTKEGRKDLKQNCLDYFLFLCYKKFSDHGTSVRRPLMWLFVSLCFFTAIPYINPLFCDFINNINTILKWIVFKLSFGCNCLDDWKGFDFIDNFGRTILPLSKFEDSASGWSGWQKFLVIIQIFINTILLFLIALGLRSKFKIR